MCAPRALHERGAIFKTLGAYGGAGETDGVARLPEVLDGAFVPVRLESVASVAVDGEAVLLHVGSGVLRHLDAVGAIVWECLDGSSTVDEIVVDLAAEFGADLDTVRQDVKGLLRALRCDGLLRNGASDNDVQTSSYRTGGTWREAERRASATRFLMEPPSS